MRLLLTASRLTPLLLLAVALACKPGAEISSSSYLTQPLSADMITLTLQDPLHTWQWRGVDFRATSSNATPHTPVEETLTKGEVTVRFQLQASGQIISEGMVVLPLYDDWRWSVDLQASTADPRLVCFGCAGSQAFPLPPAFRSANADSIWVVWGGNSISNPVVY